MDAALFHWIYGGVQRFPFDWLFGRITHLGDQRWVLSLAFAGGVEAVMRRKSLLPWAGVYAAAGVSGWLKAFFDRPRPFGGGEAFPSGHATLAFALAAALSLRWPRLKGVWISLAVLVGVSRVVLGVHWPTDVLAGAAIGFGVVGGFAWLERRLFRRCLARRGSG